jgi:hypothetical protein
MTSKIFREILRGRVKIVRIIGAKKFVEFFVEKSADFINPCLKRAQ